MNIGCVIYNKDFKTGQMLAEWHLEKKGNVVSGTGLANGEPGENYAGTYKITYLNPDGTESGPFDLIIKENNTYYSLKWYRKDTLTDTGIGMLHGDVLIAGWKNVVMK